MPVEGLKGFLEASRGLSVVALLARIYLSIPAQTHNDSALRPLGQPFIATENHYQGGLKAGKGVTGRGVNAN